MDVLMNLVRDVLVNLMVDVVMYPSSVVLARLKGNVRADIIGQPLNQLASFTAAGPHQEPVKDLVHRVLVAVC